jgi:DNA-binding transcriptional ArsR family regulator
MWRRVVARKEAALDLLGQLRCTTATQLGRRLGISHSQAYYTLKMLEGEGKVSRYRAGRAHVWCASPVSSPTEAYAIISPCLKYADKALARLIGGARGAIVTITPGDIIRTIELMFRAKCAARLGRPHLLAAARAWIETHLDGAIIERKKRETKQMQFVVDVRKARERLAVV